LETEARGDVGAGGAATASTFATQAAAMRATERFMTWVRAEPALGDVDLRPYVYFASERYALPVGVAQRLSPAGARALQDLRSNSEALHQKGAAATVTLPLPEVTAILGDLTAHARSGRVDLEDHASPLAAMVEIAKQRQDVGGDVISAIIGLPGEIMPATAPILINTVGGLPGQREAANAALESLATSPKRAVKLAAEGRLRAVREGATGKRGR
jgi:hypothetical protein